MLIHSPKELALFAINQRKKLKLSQMKIGEEVGLQQKTISAFENKPGSTQLETLFHILSALNLDLTLSPKDKTPDETKWKEEW
jgi:HTH-type transcriptional regulator/antitoxin HipB